MIRETISTIDDIMMLLDSMVAGKPGFWDRFYADRGRRVPFFMNAPDENLASYVERGLIPSQGRALDLGCGPGRNSLFLAKIGYHVDAVDYSEEAIQWARERADSLGVDVNFICSSVFDFKPQGQYDLVYDSGCMHHLWPHRRVAYIEWIQHALKTNGLFGLTCFAPGFGEQGGPILEMSDWDVYREKTMNGGLAFTEAKVRALLSPIMENVEFRAMKAITHNDELFGVPFLWTSLWKKNEF
jgi:SAM-dependent methyltransferase